MLLPNHCNSKPLRYVDYQQTLSKVVQIFCAPICIAIPAHYRLMKNCFLSTSHKTSVSKDQVISQLGRLCHPRETTDPMVSFLLGLQLPLALSRIFSAINVESVLRSTYI